MRSRFAWREGDGDVVASNGDIVLPDGGLNPAYRGRPVTLLGLSANPLLRMPGGLILDSFMQQVNTLGYRGPYVPVEKLGAMPVHTPEQGAQQALLQPGCAHGLAVA